MQLDMKKKRKYIGEAVQRYKPRVSTTFSGTQAVHLRYRSGTKVLIDMLTLDVIYVSAVHAVIVRLQRIVELLKLPFFGFFRFV